jgi:hypothetical protein
MFFASIDGKIRRRLILFLTAWTLITQVAVAQGVGINDTGAPPDPSAGLDINFINKGLLPPRLTTSQRDSIMNPIPGLQIYNTTINCMEYFRPSGWYSMCPQLATLTTISVSSITGVSALSGGQITDDGGATITARGLCWATSPNPTVSDSITFDGVGLGAFVSTIDSLQMGTTYYARAYATNSEGTAYGNEIVFTTLNKPTVSTSPITLIHGKCATSGGDVTSDGGASIISRGLCWSTTPNPSIANNVVASGTGLGTFSQIMGGLSYSTTYYIRAYATNSVGVAYGNELLFSTTTSTLVSFTQTGSSSWAVPAGVNTVEVLVVAGGGGGGGVIGGGGGGGGLIYHADYVLSNLSAVNVIVGGGGEGGRNWNSNQQNGKVGNNSVFDTLIAVGGGGGTHHGGATNFTQNSGGSGGGGADGNMAGGNGIIGQGNNGGSGGNNNGGGGGGSGSPGANQQPNAAAGNGGSGLNYSVQFGSQFGANGWFAGGGGGGVRQGFGSSGSGGIGGGGNGSSVDTFKAAQDGAQNTGGGGGGAGHNNANVSGTGNIVAGNGGSGIVLLKY